MLVVIISIIVAVLNMKLLSGIAVVSRMSVRSSVRPWRSGAVVTEVGLLSK